MTEKKRPSQLYLTIKVEQYFGPFQRSALAIWLLNSNCQPQALLGGVVCSVTISPLDTMRHLTRYFRWAWRELKHDILNKNNARSYSATVHQWFEKPTLSICRRVSMCTHPLKIIATENQNRQPNIVQIFFYCRHRFIINLVDCRPNVMSAIVMFSFCALVNEIIIIEWKSISEYGIRTAKREMKALTMQWKTIWSQTTNRFRPPNRMIYYWIKASENAEDTKNKHRTSRLIGDKMVWKKKREKKLDWPKIWKKKKYWFFSSST